MNRKRKPAIDGQVYQAMLKTADRIRAFADDLFGPYGITGQQYNVLRILRGAGPDGLPTLTVADRMIERAPGMTRMIDRLEAKGLAKRERDAKDRRCVHCFITPKGLELLKQLDHPVEETNKTLFASLKPAEKQLLAALLNRIEQDISG
jgi:DNA-binding MarR family transcriptional regulator